VPVSVQGRNLPHIALIMKVLCSSRFLERFLIFGDSLEGGVSGVFVRQVGVAKFHDQVFPLVLVFEAFRYTCLLERIPMCTPRTHNLIDESCHGFI
jgi:hypothetical protein